MQVMDEHKRTNILAAAAELFATHPFHRVLLSDVAKAAGVGKGTLYTYFQNKKDLYLSVIYCGFSRLVDHIRSRLSENGQGPAEDLEMLIRETVSFAYQNPHLFEIIRTVPGRQAIDKAKWDAKRTELKRIIESILRRGIAQGLFTDSHPEWTARYIPGLVRSMLLDGIESIDRDVLTAHIIRFVQTGIVTRDANKPGTRDRMDG